MLTGDTPPLCRPQKDLLANYERTAKLFQARFKQPLSVCGCEHSAFAAKVTGALKMNGKKATNLDDVLRVLAAAEGREQRTSSRSLPSLGLATHPCTHNMIYHAQTKRVKRAGKVAKQPNEGHMNTLIFPPASWLSTLDPASAYGYTTFTQEVQITQIPSNDGRIRPWITR